MGAGDQRGNGQSVLLEPFAHRLVLEVAHVDAGTLGLGAALGGGDAQARATFEATVRASVPLGREQTMQDIGRTVAWLCSAQAQNVTGQTIAIDGGITLGGRSDRRSLAC